MGKATLPGFEVMAVRTFADACCLPEDELRSRFGETGGQSYGLVRGLDDRAAADSSTNQLTRSETDLAMCRSAGREQAAEDHATTQSSLGRGRHRLASICTRRGIDNEICGPRAVKRGSCVCGTLGIAWHRLSSDRQPLLCGLSVATVPTTRRSAPGPCFVESIAPSFAPSGRGNRRNRLSDKWLHHTCPEFVNRRSSVRVRSVAVP